MDNNNTSKKTTSTEKVIEESPEIRLINSSRLQETYNVTPYLQEDTSRNRIFDSTKVDGKLYPLVTINGTFIEHTRIEFFELDQSDFYPTLEIHFNDIGGVFKNTNLVGQNSHINVVIVSQIEKVYKPIKMDFYIIKALNVSEEYETNKYWKLKGVMRVLELEQAPGVKGYGSLSTFDFFEKISLDTGVGFSSSGKCKSISDNIFRIINQGLKYREAIQEQIKFSGVDENSIMDCWCDVYGNLNLVNLSYIMNCDIKPDDMTIKMMSGVRPTSQDLEEQYKIIETQRTLTNLEEMGHTNLLYESITPITNNNSTYDGLNIQFDISTCEGYSDEENGSMNSEQVQYKQKSKQSQNESRYYTSKYVGSFIEMGERPTNSQIIKRDSYIKGKESIIYKVILKETNLGLMKGMLVNLLSFSRNPMVNQEIIRRNEHTFSDVNIKQNNIDIKPNNKYFNNTQDLKDSVDEQNKSNYIVNFQESGQYYIKDISIYYDYNEGKMTQTLFLIRKSDFISYKNPNYPQFLNITKKDNKK